jgi:hypothetical protein
MRTFLLVLSLLTTAAAASAQTQHVFPTPSVQAPPLLSAHAPVSASPDNCPARLSASRLGAAGAVWTISQQDASDPALRLRINPRLAGSGLRVHLEPALNIQMPHTLLHAELAVEYLAPGTRTLLVNSRNPPSARSKTFVIHAGDIPSYKIDADLLVGETAGILRVHIVSIEFANGESWTAPNARTCSTTPSPYLEVAN